ncbi:glycosyltransferase [Streptomyces violascens]|uniref:glycosyltransferase n=1 Tax=Streptomyces violascens TaxID=67381 RepID=UPI0036924FC5
MRVFTRLLEAQGHQVKWIDFRESRMPTCDIAIFLETFTPELLVDSRKSIYVPNMECFHLEKLVDVPRIDQVWAKGKSAAEALTKLGVAAHITGFASEDTYDPKVERELACLHPVGRSWGKGTKVVLEAWRRHPDLPPLFLTAEPGNPEVRDLGPGVTDLGLISPPEMRELRNRCQIHVCPSPVEGWGHAIVEGALCCAIVITTGASPMNEHIRPDSGFLLPVTGREPFGQGLMQSNHVNPDDIATAVRKAAALDKESRQARGKAAREHSLHRNASFEQIATRLIDDLVSGT